MITLKCIHCGHQIEASESVRGAAIRCARCGKMLTTNTGPADPRTEIGAAPTVLGTPFVVAS